MNKASYVLFFFVFLSIAASNAALAHDAQHPELDQWMMKLSNKDGGVCCDGKDAMETDDWSSENGHYVVTIEGKRMVVGDGQLVAGPNRADHALVWYWHLQGDPVVRCFMPGTMS